MKLALAFAAVASLFGAPDETYKAEITIAGMN